MSGWLVSVPYDSSAGLPTHEALFATWYADAEEAVRQVAEFEPRGSRIEPQIVCALSESALRGLKLSPHETGLLSADTTRV